MSTHLVMEAKSVESDLKMMQKKANNAKNVISLSPGEDPEKRGSIWSEDNDPMTLNALDFRDYLDSASVEWGSIKTKRSKKERKDMLSIGTNHSKQMPMQLWIQ